MKQRKKKYRLNCSVWNEQDLAGENQKIVEVLRHEDRGWLLGVGPLKYSLEDEVILRTRMSVEY